MTGNIIDAVAVLIAAALAAFMLSGEPVADRPTVIRGAWVALGGCFIAVVLGEVLA